MRWQVVANYTGLFLKIFSVLLLVPVVVGRFYAESFAAMEPFLLASFFAIVLGWILAQVGTDARPTAMEAMATATIAWLIAVGLGAVPIRVIADVPFIDAYLETMSGFTTTGMSVLPTLDLPHSLQFWRVFMQWIGGLGILTFFVTVIVESGGVATRLVATEANKTDGGSIRPSLFNAIKSLWYVYIVLTVSMVLLLYYAGFSGFDAVGYALATLPTGGFSTATPLTSLMDPFVMTVFTLFMFLGGTNFLLIYSVLRGNISRLARNYEFRLYLFVVCLAIFVFITDLATQRGMGLQEAAATGTFHAISVLSSTGFELEPVRTFPELSRFVIIALMFVGASLGSTTGGIKMLRFGLMLKLVKQQVKSLVLPPTVLNPVTVGRRIVRDDEMLQVASIVFIWLLAVVAGGFLIVGFSSHGIADSVQVMASAIGTMGPSFIPETELVALHPLAKIGLMIGMLAGRLEMLPLLALVNIKLLDKFA